MPSGKSTLNKKWDHSRTIRTVKPSRYQQTEAKVKKHWENVINEMESFYAESKFWESSADQVSELVGPILFKRIAKIFDLPSKEVPYEPESDIVSLVPSEIFHKFDKNLVTLHNLSRKVSLRSVNIDYNLSGVVEDDEQTKETSWSDSMTETTTEKRLLRSRSVMQLRKGIINTSSFRDQSRSVSCRISGAEEEDKSASSEDDLIVHAGGPMKPKRRNLGGRNPKHNINPHFNSLYCNEAVTDMIKWPSKLMRKNKTKVSKSEVLNIQAGIVTKEIAGDFQKLWFALHKGEQDKESEIKEPDHVQTQFEIWFDEQASRSLQLDCLKVLPCTLESIAEYTHFPEASCKSALERQISSDIKAETAPVRSKAFGTCLPEKMKHYVPRNNTKEFWNCVTPPEDLNSMSCVWGDIQHLTITKAYHRWLLKRPLLPMPSCLLNLNTPQTNRLLKLIPSDKLYEADHTNYDVSFDLALPVSQTSYDLKARLSNLMHH